MFESSIAAILRNVTQVCKQEIQKKKNPLISLVLYKCISHALSKALTRWELDLSLRVLNACLHSRTLDIFFF